MSGAGELSWKFYNEDLIARVGTTYGGRPLVVLDMDVTGGVIYDADEHIPGEALVVDPTDDPEPYDRLYKEVLAGVTVQGLIRVRRLGGALRAAVAGALPYAGSGVKSIFREVAAEYGHTDFKDGTEINLARFLRAESGLCRHHASGACYVTERLRDEKRLPLVPSFDSNAMIYPDGTVDGHAWARIGHPDGWLRVSIPNGLADPLIVDTTTGYDGQLSYAYKRSLPTWPYWRPGEEAYLRSLPG